MSRLIDADKFAHTLQKISGASWFKDEQKKPFETIINMLIGIDKEKYSPTAYDVDKVVEELQKIGTSYCTNVHCNNECCDCDHGCLMGKIIGTVKRGGGE